MPGLVPSLWTTPDLAQSVPHLFGVASIDDDVALGGGSHLTARPWSRPHPCRSQLAPGEGVQVEGVHIVVVDEISAESTFCDGDTQHRIKQHFRALLTAPSGKGVSTRQGSDKIQRPKGLG